MPRYDYACVECDRTVEVVHPITSTEPILCTSCAYPMKLVYTPVPALFKGVGFYSKDKR